MKLISALLLYSIVSLHMLAVETYQQPTYLRRGRAQKQLGKTATAPQNSPTLLHLARQVRAHKKQSKRKAAQERALEEANQPESQFLGLVRQVRAHKQMKKEEEKEAQKKAAVQEVMRRVPYLRNIRSRAKKQLHQVIQQRAAEEASRNELSPYDEIELEAAQQMATEEADDNELSPYGEIGLEAAQQMATEEADDNELSPYDEIGLEAAQQMATGEAEDNELSPYDEIPAEEDSQTEPKISLEENESLGAAQGNAMSLQLTGRQMILMGQRIIEQAEKGLLA